MLMLTIKTIHILAAIVALGTNITYGFLMNRAGTDPKQILFMLKTVRWLDRTLANKAYGISLITGLLMIWISDYSFSTLWIGLSLSLFVLIALTGFLIFAPIIKQQSELAEQGQTDTTPYKKVRKKSQILGIAVTLMVVLIVILMVFKPV